MNKIFTFLLFFAFVFSTKAQTNYTIGSGTGSNTGTSYPCPIQDYYEGSRAQYLYLASELQAAGITAGLINSIKFNVSAITAPTTGQPFTDIEQYSISIGSTSTASLSANSWEPGTTQVYGPVDYTPFVGDNEFAFSTPFFWDGTSNIVIEICNGDPNNATYTSWSQNIICPFTSGLSFNGSHTYRDDNLGNLCGTATTTNYGPQTTRPDIIMVWSAAVPCNGMPIPGTTTSSKDSVCINQQFQLSVTGGFLGTGLTYQWQYSTDNGINWQNFTGANATKFSYTVSGISVNTCFRRRTTCTNGNGVSFSASKCVVAKPFYECYCNPSTGNTLYTTTGTLTPEINSVSINGSGVAYNNSHSPSNTNPKGYALFTSDTNQLLLKQGCQYTASVSIGGTLGRVAMWADWNRNNIFDSAEYAVITYPSGSTTADAVIDVPINAPLGLTVIRFRVINGTGTLSYNQACNSFTNGEVEDYLVKVVPGIQCNGTPLGGDAKSSVDSACKNVPFLLTVDNSTTCVVGLTYQWQMQVNCTGGWTDITGATGKNYSVPTLNATAAFRRKIICGANSSFSNSVCVIAKALKDCYCSPNNGTQLQNGTKPWIEDVTLNGTGSNTYSWTASASGVSNQNNSNGYSLYDDTSMLANDLKQGNDYTISLSITTGTPTQTTAFIDWNQDGQFDVNTEKILLSPNGNGTITVPANALLGWTVMRLRTRANTFVTACETNFSGETEDYLIKVTPGTFCSGTPNAGNAFSTRDSVCKNSAFTLRDTSLTKNVIGLTYQWYTATSCGSSSYTSIPGATSLNYTVASISANTSYRLGVKCSGGTEVFSTPVCVYLKAQFECYCSPDNGTVLHNPTSDPVIDTFMVKDSCGNGINLNLFSESTNHNPTGWTLFYDTSYSFIQGESYGITANLTTNPTQATVFVDWDQSGTFENNERYDMSYPNGATMSTRFIKIPANAITGYTLMRIRVRAAAIASACETFGSGETEDHVIKIVASTPCVGGNLVGGSITSSATGAICKGVNFTLSAPSGGCSNYGISGISYQWQDSVANGSWQNVTATGSSFTTSLNNVTRYFRRKTTCSNGNVSAYSNVVTVTLNAPAYSSLPFTEGFENTWIDGCGDVDSRSIPSNFWRNTPFTGDTSWRRDDDGVSANWTNDANGVYFPSGSASNHSARFHSSSAANHATNNLDVYINCTGGAQYKRLTFDYVNPDGTDSLSILMSTDGGATFNRLDSAGVRVFWTNKTIDFVSSSATTVLRFRAYSDGAGASGSDIGIDNVNIKSLLPVDITATVVTSPTGSINATSSGLVAITYKNVGGSVIDFSATPMTFGGSLIYLPSTPKSLGSFPTRNSGTLAIGASKTDTISNNADFTSFGQYSIRIWAQAQGDGNAANDTTALATFTVNAPAKVAVASGFWGDGATWSDGTVPVATDTVNITGFTVTLSGGAQPQPYFCSSLGIGNGGSLIGNNDKLTIGTTGGSNKTFSIASGGTLNISGANIEHNGNIIFNSGSSFIQSGGNLTIDGNNGTDIGSVQSGTDLLAFGTSTTLFSTGTINLTGGNVTIVDPHRFGGSTSGVIGYRANIQNNINANHTFVFGNGTSNHTSISGSNGFYLITTNGTNRLSLGNVIVNGGNTVGNRFVSPAASIGINGNLTINTNSEYRSGFFTYFTGNLINNGVYTNSNVTFLQTFLNGTSGVVSTAQSISGNGIYRNTVPSANVATVGSGYNVGDVLTATAGSFVTPITLYVSAVNGAGGVTSAVVLNTGNYTVAPTAASAVTGGTGNSATFTLTNVISNATLSGLAINNTNAAGVSISSWGTPLAAQTGTVSGNLAINNSIVNNIPTMVLGVSTATRGNLNIGTNTGYFTGKFARWFAATTNGTTTGDLPVGKGTSFRNARVEFTSAPTKGGLLTAEFIASPSGTGGLPLVDGTKTLTSTADQGYWRIDNDTITGGNYSVSLSYPGLQTVTDFTGLRVIKRPSNTTTWTIDGLPGANTGSNASPVVVRTGMSGFSEFTVAGDVANPLPVEGITLNGVKESNKNILRWTALNEVNVKTYDVQRGNDSRSFETIATVASSSTSSASTNKYNFIDNSTIYNDGYYRIKAISKDGTVSYSNVIAIKGEKISGLFVGTLYPNPTKNSINVVVATSKASSVNINITDVNGKQIAQFNKAVLIGDNTFNIDVNKFAAGTYMLSITDTQNNKSNVVSFVKN